MNYTEGEWIIKKEHGAHAIGVMAGKKFFPVASIWLIFNEESEANAHLIAAAPDMYEALKALLPYAGGNPIVNKDDIVKGKQALAKAEGRKC